MAGQKRKKLPNEQSPKKKRHAIKILIGILCIAGGLGLNWNTATASDPPDWVNESAIITIDAEKPWADINVRCNVVKDGSLTLSLSAGERLDEPVRVWVTVLDFFYPFHWEVSDAAFSNVTLYYADSAGEATDDYPAERTFISRKNDRTHGESNGYFSKMLYFEYFTTVIEPGEQSREIKLQMDPEHTEYRTGGDIIIRMPYITGARRMPAYTMSVSDFGAIIESGDYNMLPYFSNCMIDGAAVFESALNITADYYSEYVYLSKYIVTSVQPSPEMLFPSCYWKESLQWIPHIVFHDLSYDKHSLIRSWFSGILIAIGSGLLVLPLSDWIQPMEKNKPPQRK